MENTKNVSERNMELKEELWAKGYYVQEIGKKDGAPDYLIVRCATPKEDNPNND